MELKPIVTVVSGTYNRLQLLQAMIVSARQAKGNLHFDLNFSIVDGGSTDGSIEWLKKQNDVILTEHRELLGGVKAFNDGAYAANGTYVILANDDIEFLPNSISLAVHYMQSHSDCGIGCFYQDRNGKDWHIEEMRVIKNNGNRYYQASGFYGQVCIIPKDLGDMVNWWGDYLHTYGGDNEISCNIYELGFKISPVPEAKIHDKEAADELRVINNIGETKDPRARKAINGHHPDSLAWGRKWTRRDMGNLIGPVIKDSPTIQYKTEFRPKIFYLPVYEQGWEIQKQQKIGLRNSLAKIGLVYEYDYLSKSSEMGPEGMKNHMLQIMYNFQPDIFVSQIHNTDQFTPENIQRIKTLFPNLTLINWNGDFWPDNLLKNRGKDLNLEFDIVGLVNGEVISNYRQSGINAFYWQIGWEAAGIDCPIEESCDIVFLASGYSKSRRNLAKFLKSLSYNFHLWGPSWPNDWSKGQTIYDFKKGCEIYSGAKFAIGDSQWPDIEGFVSNRLFQILVAPNSVLTHQWFKGIEKLGLVHQENCLIWRDTNELKSLIEQYINDDNELKRISNNGIELAHQRHSFDVRVLELFERLDYKETAFLDWR